MSVFKIIRAIIIFCSVLMVVFIVVDVFIKKRRLMSGRIDKISNNKYLALIVTIIILYIIYGLLRNI